jgi:hypothetical protein
MILIATFLPPTAEELVSHLDWIQEILKVVIAGVDIFGCWLLFKLRFGVSGSDIRILGTGLGWSIGENLLSRLEIYSNEYFSKCEYGLEFSIIS